MNQNVGRNEPCPCGSGKKYKKCCGQKAVISINDLLENEILELQRDIYEYADSQFGFIIKKHFKEQKKKLIIEEKSEEEFFEFVHVFWFILFAKLEDGSTILEKYIALNFDKIKRPKLQQILKSWIHAVPIAGEVQEHGEKEYVIEDVVIKETFKIVALNEQMPTYEGAIVLGMLLPYEDKYVFFPSPFEIQESGVANFKFYIDDCFEKSGYDSFQEYLTELFIEVLNFAPYSSGMVDPEGIEWGDPIYQEVAEIFQNEMTRSQENSTYIDLGILLWHMFCQKKQKRIKNPNIYAAALQYLVSTIFPLKNNFTQKELAKQYEVSATSISTAFREMDEELTEEIADILMGSFEDLQEPENLSPKITFNKSGSPMATERIVQEAMAALEGKNFDSIEEINQYINQTLNQPKKIVPNKSQSKRSKAQDLLYDAFEASGKERYVLARRALDLYPYCADAYNILAEQANSRQEATELYKKGMEAGKEDLGKDFFAENKGHFWDLVETRPFMRAKLNYASALHEQGDNTAAIQHYEELLTLNPNDNQGVCYPLFITYLESGDILEAKKLLKKSKEGSTHEAFNELLMELLEKGFTTKATKLRNEAEKQNSHVIGYLLGKTRIPHEIPESYSLGSREEAIIYATEHMHLWAKIPGVWEWMRK